LKVLSIVIESICLVSPYLSNLYQTKKVRLAVSNSFSLQCVALTLVFLATLIFVNGISYFFTAQPFNYLAF